MKTNEERIESMIQTAGDSARYQAMRSMKKSSLSSNFSEKKATREATIQRN